MKRKLGSLIWRTVCVLLVTLLLALAFLYGVMFLLCKGPSPTARDLFVRSVRETSAVGFLANLYLSEEEIAQIETAPDPESITETDTSLLAAVSPAAEEDGPYTDPWGYTDDDGDGLILVDIKGESYVGYMLIVLDPSRVVLGCHPESIGVRGYSVQEFVEDLDGVAGINGGGFKDEDITDNGSVPTTPVVKSGVIYNSGAWIGNGFVGLDDQDILRVGFHSEQDLTDWNIRDGAGYGPVLVVNGEALDEKSLASGLNPRTAIGQRSDKAILMLVIEGRQPSRLGATYMDEAEIMLKFGAVNACNLDGGSSTMMWYEGGYINNSASVIGLRPIPTSFVVLKEGLEKND